MYLSSLFNVADFIWKYNWQIGSVILIIKSLNFVQYYFCIVYITFTLIGLLRLQLESDIEKWQRGTKDDKMVIVKTVKTAFRLVPNIMANG